MKKVGSNADEGKDIESNNRKRKKKDEKEQFILMNKKPYIRPINKSIFMNINAFIVVYLLILLIQVLMYCFVAFSLKKLVK